MQLTINGQPRDFPGLVAGTSLEQLIAALALQGDRVAVEHNGEIVPRAGWGAAAVHENDRFEIVHFVGGGAA
ncbi:MAG TPA: sulfur carrier protein ThiS [Acidobacteriaceae bacterium]